MKHEARKSTEPDAGKIVFGSKATRRNSIERVNSAKHSNFKTMLSMMLAEAFKELQQ